MINFQFVVHPTPIQEHLLTDCALAEEKKELTVACRYRPVGWSNQAFLKNGDLLRCWISTIHSTGILTEVK